MEITGIFLEALDLKTFEGGFQAQEFYLDCKTYNQYTGEPIENLIKFQVTGDKINLLSPLKKGDLIKVSFSVKGKFYDKKDGTKGHIQNLNVWNIEAVETKNKTQAYTKPKATPQDFEEIEDDLPF